MTSSLSIPVSTDKPDELHDRARSVFAPADSRCRLFHHEYQGLWSNALSFARNLYLAFYDFLSHEHRAILIGTRNNLPDNSWVWKGNINRNVILIPSKRVAASAFALKGSYA